MFEFDTLPRNIQHLLSGLILRRLSVKTWDVGIFEDSYLRTLLTGLDDELKIEDKNKRSTNLFDERNLRFLSTISRLRSTRSRVVVDHHRLRKEVREEDLRDIRLHSPDH